MNDEEIEILDKKKEEKNPLCNICGKHADWLVVFSDRKTKKRYATTRCREHSKTPEPKLDNLISYDQKPLWYGSWRYDADEGSQSLLSTISREKIHSTLRSDIILLPNSFEEQDE